ncbi:hypothetical protein BJY00DRAFT_294599 [Aspergillus carlsbadensis]|nr:hypothetical protein BJY00DRAFT_294599 [Aspergillus carlsbadensis]
MAEPSIQGFEALSKSHVSTILDASSFRPADKFALLPIEMRFLSFTQTGTAGDVLWMNHSETKAALEQWCRDAFAFMDTKSDHDLGSHLEQLDALLSTLMICNFQTYKQEMGQGEIVDKACALVARLPSHPPELPFEYGAHEAAQMQEGSWPPEYFVSDPTVPNEWAHLRVLSRPSTNVVRLALFLAMDRSLPLAFTSEYSDTIVRLLDTAASLLHQSPTETEARAWFILQAFLWAEWQQTVMLQLWYDGKRQISGYRFDRHNDMIAKQIPSAILRPKTIGKSRPKYMCRWAFELLRSDLSCVTQDFRKLFEIYKENFGDCSPRCNLNAAGGPDGDPAQRKRICDGRAPGNCQRFESVGIKEQSAHDFACPGVSACSLLTWHEESYRNLTGSRAVSLDETDDELIRYCPLSGETLAISHVWSHGQGGRPETGFNICLHRRYAALARALGCTSYWMDTPCIPSDDELRDEAIGQINANFETSKITLLIDRDLMQVDISPRTLQSKESVLATLVVCDWNVRAWTLLEGMRGRVALHILCKNNNVISLVDVLTNVFSNSSLSLISPALAVQHYTPVEHRFDGTEPVTIEQATCLLNHRHSDKDRDIPMIWSLVCGSTVAQRAEVFWQSKVGDPLATGFLVSSAPRIKDTHGLGWAPARPNLLPLMATTKATADPNADLEEYPAYDGQDSLSGTITSSGFKAEWLGSLIRRRGSLLPAWMFSISTFDQQDGGRRGKFDDYFRVYNQGGNEKMDMKARLRLCAVIGPLFQQFRWVALLMPALRDRGTSGATSPPRPFVYQGEARGLMVVVATSNDLEEWQWQFVHEWDGDLQLPEFSLANILMV